MRAEDVHHVRADDDEHITISLGKSREDGAEMALELDAHGERRLDLAVALALRALLVHRVREAFMQPLAGHFHEAKLRDGQDLRLGLVPLRVLDHGLVDRLLVLAALHVDEVHHDEAAHVPQTQLTRDFGRGLHVGLEDDAFLAGTHAGAFVAAGVHVDRDKRFGLVDDDVAAAGQPHLAEEGLVDLPLDVVFLKEQARPREVVDAAHGAA